MNIKKKIEPNKQRLKKTNSISISKFTDSCCFFSDFHRTCARVCVLPYVSPYLCFKKTYTHSKPFFFSRLQHSTINDVCGANRRSKRHLSKMFVIFIQVASMMVKSLTSIRMEQHYQKPFQTATGCIHQRNNSFN